MGSFIAAIFTKNTLMVYNIDVQETEVEMNRFKEEYSELVGRSKRKLDEDHIWVWQMLEEEQKMKKHPAEGFGAGEVWFSIIAVLRTCLEGSEKALNASKAKGIIDGLCESDLPAKVILDRSGRLKLNLPKRGIRKAKDIQNGFSTQTF